MDLIYRATGKPVKDNSSEYVMSDETVDSYGDIISVAGWDLSRFAEDRNPVALFNHISNAVIGRWHDVRVEAGKLIGRLELAAAGTSATVDYVRSLVSQDILRAVSVGFRDIEKEMLTKDGDPFWGPFHYLKQELVECSLVAVPANPNALQISKSFDLPAEVRRSLVSKVADDRPRRPAAIPGKLATRSQPGTGGKTMRISDRIKQTQNDLKRMREQLASLPDIDEMDDGQVELFESLPDEIAANEVTLERLMKAEKALMQHAGESDDATRPQPEIIPPGRTSFRAPLRKPEPIDFIIRAAACAAISKLKQVPVEKVRAALYGEDETTAIVVRAVTNPAQTTVPGWASELVQVGVGAFLDTLKPDTIFPVLRSRGSSFSFGPTQGSIRVPGRTATPTLAGAWVGEGQPIPVRRLGFTSVLLGPKKLAVISTFTQELADYSTPNIERVIRDAMDTDTSLVIDTYLLDANPADVIRPPGLRNGVTGLTPSTDPNKTNAMIADIKALVSAIITANGGRDIVVIMNTVQGMGINFAQNLDGFLFGGLTEAGQRFGVTFATSTAVPAGLVVAVDAAEFATASGDTPDFNVSDQATIHEEDTAPLPIVGTGGTPVTANPVRSLWQTDTIGVRMRLPLNWSMRRPNMVSWMTGVTW